MESFDILSEFLDDKPYMTLLLTVDDKALVSYLADIFEILNDLNKELQGTNMTIQRPSYLALYHFWNYPKKIFMYNNFNNFIG